MRYGWEPEDPADVVPVTQRLEAALAEAPQLLGCARPDVDVMWPEAGR